MPNSSKIIHRHSIRELNSIQMPHNRAIINMSLEYTQPVVALNSCTHTLTHAYTRAQHAHLEIVAGREHGSVAAQHNHARTHAAMRRRYR